MCVCVCVCVCVCDLGAAGLCLFRAQQSNMLLITVTSSISLGRIHRYNSRQWFHYGTPRTLLLLTLHPEHLQVHLFFSLHFFKMQVQCYVFGRFNVFIFFFSPLNHFSDASLWAALILRNSFSPRRLGKSCWCHGGPGHGTYRRQREQESLYP